MRRILRSLLVTSLTGLLVLEGAAARKVSAAEPVAAARPVEDASAAGGFPTWAKWLIGGVVVATGVALLFAFVIVPKAIEDSVDDGLDPCCEGGGDGDAGMLP